MATMTAAIVTSAPATAITAIMTAVVALMPTGSLAVDLGHINHLGRWRQVNDPRGWGHKYLAGSPDLRLNWKMAKTGMHDHQRFHKNRMGTTHLGQTQHQTAQEQGIARPDFEQ